MRHRIWSALVLLSQAFHCSTASPTTGSTVIGCGSGAEKRVIMEGPLITDPSLSKTKECGSSEEIERDPLYDLTVAFRECVALGRDLQAYQKKKRKRDRNSAHVIIEKTDDGVRSSEASEGPYLMASCGVYNPSGELSVKSSSSFPGKKKGYSPNLDFSASYRTDALVYPSNSKPKRGSTGSIKPAFVARIRAVAPDAFRGLRRSYGIREFSYYRSLLQSGPYVSFQSNSKGAERAGGVFFFTRDGAYMIKTIKPDEEKALLNLLLPKYSAYMKRDRNGKRSLLNRVCGVYQVQIINDNFPITTVQTNGQSPQSSTESSSSSSGNADVDTAGGEWQTIVVMNAVFPAAASKLLTERFDLKGSKVGRECKPEELQKAGAVLKDMDLRAEVEADKAAAHAEKGPSKRIKTLFGLNIGSKRKDASKKESEKKNKTLFGLSIGSKRKDASKKESEQKTKTLFGLNIGSKRKDASKKESEKRTKPLAKRTKFGLHIGRKRKEALMLQLRKDVDLLAACEVIDYSLLVGVHLTKNTPSCSSLSLNKGVPIPCGVCTGPLSVIRGSRRGQPCVFYLGVIDFLQPWNNKKWAEWKVKALYHERAAYSCVPPEDYAERFLGFLDEHIT